MPPLSPRLRRALGSLAIVLWLVFWIVAAASVGERLGGAPKFILALYYAVAGVGWGLPLWPLFRWMRA